MVPEQGPEPMDRSKESPKSEDKKVKGAGEKPKEVQDYCQHREALLRLIHTPQRPTVYKLAMLEPLQPRKN